MEVSKYMKNSVVNARIHNDIFFHFLAHKTDMLMMELYLYNITITSEIYNHTQPTILIVKCTVQYIQQI